MADPLSVTASAIAVIGAAQQVCKGVSKLRALQKAPEEFSALMNEVSDLQVVLQQVVSVTCDFSHEQQRRGEVAALKSHIKRAKDQLLRLDELVTSNLTKYARNGDRKVARMAWMLEQNRVRTMTDGLRSVRWNIATGLGIITTSTVSRVELSIQRISADHALTSNAMAQILNQLNMANLQSPPWIMQDTATEGHRLFPESSITRLEMNQAEPGDTPALDRRNVMASARGSFQASRGRRPSEVICVTAQNWHYGLTCLSWCSCICHKRTSLRLPRSLRLVLGNLFVGYSGLPLITPKCNERSCRRRSAPLIDINYYFPTWFFARAVAMSVTISSFGISQSIRMPRMLDWSSPLWQYARIDELSGIQTLFSSGRASPFDINAYGRSALHYAAEFQKLDMCRFLIENGADTYLQDENGRKPIDSAWENVFSNRLTLEDPSALNVIFRDGDYTETREFTVIHKIVLGLLAKPLEAELEASTAYVDAVDANRRTALSWAAARKDAKIAQTLLDAGANPNITDFEGYPPLFHAARTADLDCIKLLISHGTNLRMIDAFGATALHIVSEAADNPALLEVLVSAGLDVNTVDFDGDTSLSYAARDERVKNVQYLLSQQADPNIVNVAGETALHMAIHSNSVGCLRELLHANVSPNIRNTKRQTILHSAAREGMSKVLKMLQALDFSTIDPNVKDSQDMTAAQIFAERCGFFDVDRETHEAFFDLLDHASQQYENAKASPNLGGDEDMQESFHDALESFDAPDSAGLILSFEGTYQEMPELRQ